ncbi:MAG: alpha-ketoglutarate-dependent dioxygenase AlkB [Flavobacteriaceae bacterium]|nr:alpha-ketoglutarate-dependent dioxygenase AlkB [Flavobacteriaceae bacterium]
MDLFDNEIGASKNLLPHSGEVNYFGAIMSVKMANHYFEILLNDIDWKNDEAILFGKRIITKRKVAWYGDEQFEYEYSNTTKKALPWTKALLSLKSLAEENTGEKFNSCLLNLYHNQTEGMAWHSDAEKKLKRNGAIASLSFGAERTFSFKHKVSKEKISVVLSNGSLLVMKGKTQTNWLHRLPPTKYKKGIRINLTFRTIV